MSSGGEPLTGGVRRDRQSGWAERGTGGWGRGGGFEGRAWFLFSYTLARLIDTCLRRASACEMWRARVRPVCVE